MPSPSKDIFAGYRILARRLCSFDASKRSFCYLGPPWFQMKREPPVCHVCFCAMCFSSWLKFFSLVFSSLTICTALWFHTCPALGLPSFLQLWVGVFDQMWTFSAVISSNIFPPHFRSFAFFLDSEYVCICLILSHRSPRLIVFLFFFDLSVTVDVQYYWILVPGGQHSGYLYNL